MFFIVRDNYTLVRFGDGSDNHIQVPADVVDAPPLGFEVWVRDEHFDRAKAILDATQLTEEELTYLATGALGEEPGTS